MNDEIIEKVNHLIFQLSEIEKDYMAFIEGLVDPREIEQMNKHLFQIRDQKTTLYTRFI